MEPSVTFSLPNGVSRDSNAMFNFCFGKQILLLTLSGNKMWSLYKTDLRVPFFFSIGLPALFFRKSRLLSKSFPARANYGIPKSWDTSFMSSYKSWGPVALTTKLGEVNFLWCIAADAGA